MEYTKNIQLFHKFYNVVNTVLTIFGLSFISRNEDTGKYQLSYKRLAYGFFICLLVLFIFYQQITLFYPKELENLVLLLLYLYLAVVGTLMAMLMVATAAFHVPGLTKILNNPEYFELFGLDMYDFVMRSSIQQFCFAFFVLLACYISDFVARGNYTLLDAIATMMFFFFPMYNSFCLCQLFNFQYWLQRWYWNVNEGLQLLLDQVAWGKLQKEHSFGLIEMSRCLQIGSGNAFIKEDNSLNWDRLMAEELIRLRRIYYKTHKITQELNDLHSLRNVLLVLHHCALEIIYTYWGLRHTLEDLGVSLSAILNFYKAAFMSFVSFVSMVWPCTTTRVEAKRTERLLQDLLAKTKNGESRTEIHIFSVQLMQQKFEFSPFGFFDIDTNLLLSLLAVATSYLVILLQYHMMNIALQASKNSQVGVISNITDIFSNFTL